MKKILIIILGLIGFAQAQVNVAGYIQTNGVASYPTHIDSMGKGGYVVVYDTTQRNSITCLRRKFGMAVYTQKDTTLWILRDSSCNNNWSVFSTGGNAGAYDSLLKLNNTWLGVNKFNRQIEVDSLKAAGTLYITGNLENSSDIKAGRRLQAGKSLVGNGIFRFYNYNHNYRTDLQGDSMLTSNVDLLLPSSSGKLALTTDIAPVDTSIIATKAYVNYKDDIQQGFIDMRKLDSDTSRWKGYTTRERTQQQLDSAGAAQQAMIHDTINNLNRLKAGTSAGVQLLSNSGATVAEFGLGGGTNFDFHGFAGYDANRSASYTDRSFTDKKYVDSTALLLARLAAVNIFTTRNTFNGALFGNKDSIPISTTNQWIIAYDTTINRFTRINRIAAFVPNADTTISTNYTLTQRDLGRSIYCTNTSLITITIPTGLTTGITLFQDRRYNIGVYQEGTGNGLVQFAASGTTIQSTEGALKTRVANSYAEIKFKSDTVIKLVGDII